MSFFSSRALPRIAESAYKLLHKAIAPHLNVPEFPREDSNPHKQIQSLLCYHYTTGESPKYWVTLLNTRAFRQVAVRTRRDLIADRLVGGESDAALGVENLELGAFHSVESIDGYLEDEIDAIPCLAVIIEGEIALESPGAVPE